MTSKLHSYTATLDAERQKKKDGQTLTLLHLLYLMRLGQLGLFPHMEQSKVVSVEILSDLCDQIIGAAVHHAKDHTSSSKFKHKVFELMKNLDTGSEDYTNETETTTFKQIKEFLNHFWENTVKVDPNQSLLKEDISVVQFESMMPKSEENQKTFNDNSTITSNTTQDSVIDAPVEEKKVDTKTEQEVNVKSNNTESKEEVANTESNEQVAKIEEKQPVTNDEPREQVVNVEHKGQVEKPESGSWDDSTMAKSLKSTGWNDSTTPKESTGWNDNTTPKESSGWNDSTTPKKSKGWSAESSSSNANKSSKKKKDKKKSSKSKESAETEKSSQLPKETETKNNITKEEIASKNVDDSSEQFQDPEPIEDVSNKKRSSSIDVSKVAQEHSDWGSFDTIHIKEGGWDDSAGKDEQPPVEKGWEETKQLFQVDPTSETKEEDWRRRDSSNGNSNFRGRGRGDHTRGMRGKAPTRGYRGNRARGRGIGRGNNRDDDYRRQDSFAASPRHEE